MTTRTRSLPLVRTDQIIEELFTRVRAGVYARYRRGRPVVAFTGPFHDQLGLTLALEHELHSGAEPDQIGRDADAAADAAWRSGELAMLTTPELLDRLHCRPGPWVLGLICQRPRRHGLQVGTFYRGDPFTCAGLAGHLGWMVARAALRNRQRQPDVSPEPEDTVREVLDVLERQVEDGVSWISFMSGLPILLEHALWSAMEQRR